MTTQYHGCDGSEKNHARGRNAGPAQGAPAQSKNWRLYLWTQNRKEQEQEYERRSERDREPAQQRAMRWSGIVFQNEGRSQVEKEGWSIRSCSGQDDSVRSIDLQAFDLLQTLEALRHN